MTSNILDGKAIAEQERQQLAEQVSARIKKGYRRPGLAVIIVGEDPASHVYVRNKQRHCQEVGIYSERYDFSENVTTEILLEKINELNLAHAIDGILVQLPLPKHIDANRIIEAIDPQKDVDGFHPFNMGRLVQNQPGLYPCTPRGIMMLLAHTDLNLKGLQACVVGASSIVGKPMALELTHANATVTLCHRYTHSLPDHLETADLVIVAIGQPEFIQGKWLKKGACVIDVGTNLDSSGKLVGDIDFASARARAKWITPVPGGVGPMTILALLKNTILANQMRETSRSLS
jgi:methylenetetrahydrofolate dehydrogenase (NADP+) / methenyltetrahydrofolate cyclohydrolase